MRKNGLRDGGLFHARMISGRPGKMALARLGPGLRQASEDVWAGGCGWMVLSMPLAGSQLSGRGRSGRSVMRTPRAPRRTLQCSPPARRAQMLQAQLTRITMVIFRLVRLIRLARAMAHSNGRLCTWQCCRPPGPALCHRPQGSIGARQALVRRIFMQGVMTEKIIAACACFQSVSGSYGFAFESKKAMQAIVFEQRRCDAPSSGAGMRRRRWLAIAG